MSQAWARIRLIKISGWVGDAAFTLAAATLIALTLGIGFLNSHNWPSGGDAASHLLYAWLYSEELLFSGHITAWLPEVFGGLPFLSYYFPLPFIVMALMSKLIGVASAFKWGSFLAAMLLPGAVYVGSRHWLKLSWPAALFGALGALAFVLHEQHSIWGGNLLSTLAGEFSYSYGMLFAVLAMMAWVRAVSIGRGWVLAALLEAASGFSHGFPLLVLGFSTAFLLLDNGNFRRTFFLLLRGHLLAFCLLGGWLWPMIEMHGIAIPNDAAFPLSSWRDLLPASLWPLLAGGLVGIILLVFPAVRRGWSVDQARAVRFFISGALLAALGFIAGDQLGLADIRFFPLTLLFGAIACGWLLGQALTSLTTPTGRAPGSHAPDSPPRDSYIRDGRTYRSFTIAIRSLFAAAACLGLLGWLGTNVRAAPDWALWNHAGLEAKPQWHNLSKLFPAMTGDLWSTRLVFEHDPDNNDVGSTRTLEALSMFLNHRPVLEGLYMESAILGPAIYLLQSEVSQRPSSPLVRFPSASLDPEFAAQHMNSLHSDTLLLRSRHAQAAIEASGLFEKTMASPPFAVYKLKKFDSHLAQVVTQPLRILPTKDWMQDAFAWFRTRSRFEVNQPVYSDSKLEYALPTGTPPVVRETYLSRHEFKFETEAVNQPHLIKIAYHPRWHLLSKGSLSIAAPGYMLVIPQEKEIRLVYGHTLVGKLGMAATLGAILTMLFLAWQRRRHRAAQPLPDMPVAAVQHGVMRRWLPLLTAWVLLAAIGAYIANNSPEKIYNLGWEAMRSNQHEKAAAYFIRAYKLRRPPSKKEEALFWSAKATELAGDRSEAKARYQELVDSYHGFWLPEGLYSLIQFQLQDAQVAEAEKYSLRLRDEYPSNPWTLRLGVRSAESYYEHAWNLMRANQYQQASEQFAHAYQLRQSPAAKEEALFWLAKSSELAGNRAGAKIRYRELVGNYHGYWLPESLYTLTQLERQDGRGAGTEKFIRRLRSQFPDNRWTLKLDELK